MLHRLISNDLPRSRLLAVLLIVILLGLAFAPFLFPGVKALSVAAKVLIFVVLVAGFDLLLGYTGIVSFGSGSTTRILPDLSSDKKIPGTSLAQSSKVNIEGLGIHFAGGSSLIATSLMTSPSACSKITSELGST